MTAFALGLAVLLGALALFFALAGASLAASSRERLLQLERTGDPRALRLDRLLGEPDQAFAALRLGRGIARVGGAVLAGAVGAGLGGSAGVALALLLALAFLTFGDAAARLHGAARAEAAALALEAFIVASVRFLAPAARLIDEAARALVGGRAPGRPAQGAPPSADIIEVAGAPPERADPSADELEGLVVSDVMVHRTDMAALDAALPVPDLIRQKLDSRFARLPLFRDAPDNIVGVIETARVARSLLAVGGDVSRLSLDDILTPPWFVPDTTPARDQLRAFLKRRAEIALVVDEYGGVMGLVTLSDLIKEIAGDITHATVLDVPGLRPQVDGSYLVEGQVPIRDLNRALDWELPDSEATTIAGLVVYEARTIPEPGQAFTFYGFTFGILGREGNRVTRLKVVPTGAARRRAAVS